ncbi:Bug family tripartite tricarboxylate transporter substrate binding protein [Bordetella petrii]|uniref:Bug family tripartite tricarboxylate transporter substrate binding protein n=1 Tax=Bordetella petrii TaxID=94624 RepID=UPI001A96C31D|nr:tripartite tricarboxylate transporter substrate binding protein [Bordetella petrii]MBO1114076.1 tripartite tricarboxylate transporter substrate binding protein [Bordetella petrii]
MNVRMQCARAAAAMMLGLACAAAQGAWPDRPVRLVVSSGAGGSADILARSLAEKLAQALGQPFIVENRPGAGGHLGAAQVARSPADGYVFLVSGSPTHSVGPHLYKNLTYDPMRDVPPVAMVAIAPNLLVVNPDLPVKSVAQLVALAKQRPGELTYSSAGRGTSGHLAGAMLQNMAHVRIKHVPYKSGPEAVTAVLAGNVSMTFFTMPSVLPQVRAGKLRALAVTSRTRTALAPSVPTVAEAGYPGFEALAWYGLFAPRDTPREAVTRLSAEIERIVRDPDMKARLTGLGAEPHYLDAAQLEAYVAVESPKWKTLIDAFGAEAD